MRKEKLYLFGSTLLLATLATSAMAGQADYQAEVGYELLQRDFDNSDNAESTIHLLSFEYFLETVKIDNQPLAEAAFMNRISSVAAGLIKRDIEADDQTIDGNGHIVAYTHMQQGSPLLLQAAYFKESLDFDLKDSSLVDYSYDRTGLAIGIGRFIAQNTAVAFDYTKEEFEYSPSVYSSNDYTLTRTRINAKHLMSTGNGKMVNIEGIIGIDNYDKKSSADTKNTVIEITGDYYLNNRQSIGGTFEKVTGDDNGEKGQAIAVHGRFFFTSKFSLVAEIYQFSGDGTSIDRDEISINANLRF